MEGSEVEGERLAALLGGNAGQLEAYTQEEFHTFLRTYTVNAATQGEDTQPTLFYASRVEHMRLQNGTTLYVDWGHFREYNVAVADIVAEKFYRLEPALRQAVRNFVEDIAPDFVKDDALHDRDFYLSIYGLPSSDRLRDLRVEKVGGLSCFAGTITRTSEVRPELFQGAFKCQQCNTVVRGIEQQFKYTEPIICSNQTCGNRKQWLLVREESVFVDWQRIKVQENVDEVPAGSLPRTMDVIVRLEQVEMVKAGDKAVFFGCLAVVPDVGSMLTKVSVSQGAPKNGGGSDGFTTKSFGSKEMSYRLMFIANGVQAADMRNGMVNIRPDVDLPPEEVLQGYEPHHAQEVLDMAADPLVYAKLTQSICPSVWGHDSIKQAVLLMLLGGVHKTTAEGISLRGDINVAIVGDPACAKSQILKFVSGFLPRAVYASGKASTAAGLTASVVKEPENGEFAIEAGALMLADNGVCCIDEFDKMDVKDQVAIHEAMEQQTISITKAGIQATLNARASILAAANPMGGRYDKSKPLKYNVALPPAILSRFDLLHVMLDETTEETDNKIAQHIIRLHRYKEVAFSNVPYSTEQIQRYIKYTRSIKPQMNDEAAVRMVQAYKELRTEDAVPGTSSAYRITVRQLEALVRLSEAMARAHCCYVITPEHVNDAKRLLRSSILRIEQQDVELEQWEDPDRPLMDPEHMENVDPEGVAAGQEQGPGQENIPGAANGADPAARENHPQSGGQGSATGAAPPRKAKMTITAQKFSHIKGMLVQHMLEEQEAHYRAADARAAALLDGSSAADAEDEEPEGVKQERLMTWYLNEQQTRGVLKLEEDMEAEMQLLFKVINHLIRKDQVLAVLFKPQQNEGEADVDYLERMQMERVLTLHASYNPDE